MMKAFCIVGTDTEIGKTIVTAGIANFFQEKYLNFDVQKWISTGDKEGVSQDLLFVFRSLEIDRKESLCFPPFKEGDNTISGSEDSSNPARKIKNKRPKGRSLPESLIMTSSISHSLKSLKRKIDFTYRNPFSFKFPASPHLSAELENRKIEIKAVEKSIEYFKSRTDYLIIEGVGGLMVPLSQKILLVDLIKKIDIPVILVSPNILGTINKTLLSIKLLKEYKVKILGIIYNNYFKENKKIRDDNKKIIYKFSKVRILGEVNKIKTKSDLIRNFKGIGKNLLRELGIIG